MQKTLGGERLHSGKKMKVDLHGYERSTHDQSFVFRTTGSVGTLIPFMSMVGLPGTTFDINLDANVMTHPTLGPLFGSFKMQLDVFQIPMRLYQGKLHNNKLKIGMDMSSVKLPQITLTAPSQPSSSWDTINDWDNAQINPSCILAYLGIRGIGVTDGVFGNNNRPFNAIPYLSYVDIYKNYYANKQEEIGAVIHTAAVPLGFTVSAVEVDGAAVPPDAQLLTGSTISIHYTGTMDLTKFQLVTKNNGTMLASNAGAVIFIGSGQIDIQWDIAKYGADILVNWQTLSPNDTANSTIDIVTFPLSDIDDMREAIMDATSVSTHFQVLNQTLSPYQLLKQTAGGFRSVMNSQEGLLLKAYDSDLLNNWLSTEWIDGPGGINEITSVSTAGGSFEIDALIMASKVYKMLMRIGVSDGTYDSWIEAVYDHQKIRAAETPMYMGGLMKEVIFQEVVSQAAAQDGTATQPLGTLGGRGKLSPHRHKGGEVIIKCDEHCYIIGIVSLTPRLDYSQGNQWDTHIETMNDWHKPALDGIGFQELITEQMAWWDTHQDPASGNWITKSAGKQPAWVNYMTEINKVRGNFAIDENEGFMVLTRRYQPNLTGSFPTIQDVTTYIDPRKFNHIFAQTSLDAQNFWIQIGCDITARRKMSAKTMPNL